MSRVGNAIIELPEGVQVTVAEGNNVTVKGPKGELNRKFDSDLKIKIEDGILTVERPTEQKRHKALHGLSRALLNNMVIGVSKGYEIQQELVGVGYRANVKGQQLELTLGYSHNIVFELPQEINAEAKQERGQNPIITLQCIDKELIGLVASKIRSLRKPEPYKGKGIKFVGEQLRRKAGKAAAKA